MLYIHPTPKTNTIQKELDSRENFILDLITNHPDPYYSALQKAAEPKMAGKTFRKNIENLIAKRTPIYH